MTEFTRKCPTCKTTISYSNKYNKKYAERDNRKCSWCTLQERKAKHQLTRPLERICPKCHALIFYTDGGNRRRAEAKNSVCNKCTVRHSSESNEKIRQALLGKKHPNRASNTKKGKLLPFKRYCPNCKQEMSYASEYSVERANKTNAVCNSCSAYLYKKSWAYVIKDKHIQQMAATKAGYDTFEDYMADLSNKKKYRREVARITKQQDLSLLENYDKMRGLCGVKGAYQLDHIISIVQGYEQGLPAEQVGSLSNLRIIPWKDNLLKSNN